MRKQSAEYHTPAQTHAENDIRSRVDALRGDGHDYCVAVERELRAQNEVLARALEESEACRVELRQLVAGGLRGGR